MPTLKDVELKIKAVKKTKQITKAMNMVATSRLRGAQSAMDGFRPYAEKFSEVLGSLAEKAGEEASPLLIPKEEVRKIHIVLCTSDRGLCGGFNVNLIEKADSFVTDKSGGGIEISFTNFGKKGRDWCRKQGFDRVSEHLGIGNDEVSEDGQVSLERVECNAACDYAPVVMVNHALTGNSNVSGSRGWWSRTRCTWMASRGPARRARRSPGPCRRPTPVRAMPPAWW